MPLFHLKIIHVYCCKLLKFYLINIGVVKDYFLAAAANKGEITPYWCSSSSWIFSQLPEPSKDEGVTQKLNQINTFFTGEFDQVLFESSGPDTVIDENLGLVMKAKPITELDRLAHVWQQIRDHQCYPKGYIKFTPA